MSAYGDARKSWSDVISTTIGPSSSGDNTLIAATTGRKIRVLACSISAASSVNVKFTSSTTSDLTKLFYLATGELNIALPYNPMGWFQTVAGELLGMNLSGGVVVAVQLTYAIV